MRGEEEGKASPAGHRAAHVSHGMRNERAKANGLRAVVTGGACRPVCVERSVNWLGLAWNRSRAAGCACHAAQDGKKGPRGLDFRSGPAVTLPPCGSGSTALDSALRRSPISPTARTSHASPPPPAPLAPVPAHHPSAVHPISSPRQRLITTHISVSHRLSHHHQTHTQHLHSTKTLLIPVTTSYPFPFFSLRL